jgi:hypothetical protein
MTFVATLGWAPGPTECYRLAMVWGLVIGWLITPAVNYGPAITDANLSHMVGACQDLDSFALLS